MFALKANVFVLHLLTLSFGQSTRKKSPYFFVLVKWPSILLYKSKNIHKKTIKTTIISKYSRFFLFFVLLIISKKFKISTGFPQKLGQINGIIKKSDVKGGSIADPTEASNISQYLDASSREPCNL